jgi:hypothetical protein
MVKKYLRGKTPMLVLYAHGTDYRNSVAIVRLADVAALGGRGSTNEGERKGADYHSLGMQFGHSPQLPMPKLAATFSPSNRKERPASRPSGSGLLRGRNRPCRV